MRHSTPIAPAADATPRISVVLPLFNERDALRPLYAELLQSVRACGGSWEFIFVNDGSRDDSGAVLDQLAEQDARVRVLHLSRNFGHQAAVQAGLSHARGDAVIVMDSDLQDDPACLTEFVRQWQAGHDVVYAVRTKRKEGCVKRLLFFAFYRLLNTISNTPVPNDAGNFGLISRRVVDQLVELNEYDRYYPGLRQWVGFKQVGVPVERGARHDGTPRVSLLGLFRLAKTALFSFSAAPLTLFYGISALALSGFFALALMSLYCHFAAGVAVPNWMISFMTGSLFGALNALGIAVLGEYVLRTYDQVRGRPNFIVAREVNCPDRTARADALSSASASASAGASTAKAADDQLVADAIGLRLEVSDALAANAPSAETTY